MKSTVKGMDVFVLSMFNKSQQKHLKSFPDLTKMTPEELKSEFWSLQLEFFGVVSQEFAEGEFGQVMLKRQQLLNERHEELTSRFCL